MERAKRFMESYERDIKQLQLKLVSIERAKRELTKEIRKLEIYKERSEMSRKIKQIRELIDARNRELSGAKKLLKVLEEESKEEQGGYMISNIMGLK